MTAFSVPIGVDAAESPTLRVAGLLRAAERLLARAGIDTARLDAELLLATALMTDRAGLYARLQDSVSDIARDRLQELLARRARREPLAYIVGCKEFWSLELAVAPGVLIPRPETEHLVAATVERLRRHARPKICDVGTGSGCVAVAVAHALPTAYVLATDISRAALCIARQNAERNGVAERIRFVAADFLTPFPQVEQFHAVVSNPPYLRPGDRRSPELDWEPAEAFAAGDDGLAAIRQLIDGAPALLAERGFLAMEIGYGQAADAVALARGVGLERVTIDNDLAGIPRVLIAHAAS